MKRVLVTGAYGFIGRHTARLYAQKGWDVVGMGHGIWSQEEWRKWGISEWHTCDITFDSLLTYAGQPDIIVHCAGGASVTFSMSYPLQDYQRTVNTTLSVLEFVRLHAPHAAVVFPSSGAVYGKVEKLPITEDCVLNPVSFYGLHKKIAEELCRFYAQHFGISVAIIRLFSAYGDGLRKQLLWDACLKIKRNEFTFFGSGNETRDWLYIEDISELLFEASRHASNDCPIVNGGTGIGVTVSEILKELFRCFQCPRAPEFNGIIRSGDPFSCIADISLAKKWGWVPKVAWQKGVNKYAQWFKEDII